MSDYNHTPDPWILCPDLTIRSKDFDRSTQTGDFRGCIVADLKPALGAETKSNIENVKAARAHAVPETLANAALILAAPDLLRAYKEALHQLTPARPVPIDGLDRTRMWLRDAIAKAEGTTP